MLDVRSELSGRLADLVASRLCHDLVNPLGAIGNGVELLEMTGKVDGPEMDLIRDAVRAAEARIRLLRLAFGGAGPDQSTSEREAREAAEGYFHQSRINVHWNLTGDRPRREIKFAFLMLLCGETVLPMGGDLDVSASHDCTCRLEAQGPRLNVNAPMWELIRTGTLPEGSDMRPADAQFPILIRTAATLGLSLDHHVSDTSVTLTARI